PTTGETLQHFSARTDGAYYFCAMEISPDRRTLYTSDYQTVLAKYDISTGAAPVLLQRITIGPMYDSTFAVTPDGHTLLHGVTIRSADDLGVVTGTLTPVSPLDTETMLSRDGRFAFRTTASARNIHVFDVATGNLVRSILLPDNAAAIYGPSCVLTIDETNSELFVATQGSTAGKSVYVFPVAPLAGPPAPPHSLLNVATRLRTQAGDDALIGGFILSGSEAKKVIIRAIGPSLSLAGKLSDPVLELHASDGSVLSSNDNWNAHRTAVIASGIPPTDEHEAAIVATLEPGAYTAILRGIADTTGIAVVEVYDLAPNSDSHLANISTRGKVETDDNVMIGGFIIGGDQPTKVIVRAIGPSLATSGVSGALADTTLELHDSSGATVASNDDWQSDQEQEIIATTIPPTDPRESAIVSTLQPGSYTAIVRGKNNTTGVALVEVYNLENN
ncbi:MAG: hypothetical protein ACXV9Q_01125, partial [Chthoniobacterales bacterium]